MHNEIGEYKDIRVRAIEREHGKQEKKTGQMKSIENKTQIKLNEVRTLVEPE